MKLRAITFSFMTLILASMIVFNPTPAHAQVTCTAVDPSPTLWPPASAAKDCAPGPNYAGVMRETLETIGGLYTDAAIRLRESVPASKTVGVTIHDPAITLTGHEKNITVETESGDSSVTLAAKLAGLINIDTDVNSVVISFASGSDVIIISLTSNTTYVDIDDTGVTVDLIDLGDDVYSATVKGTAQTAITWYYFADYADYYADSESNGGPPDYPNKLRTSGNPFDDNSILGDTLPGLHYTAVFEEDGDTNPNNIVAHTTAHETSHHLDRIYGQVYNPGHDYSASTDFLKALEIDKKVLSRISPCDYDAFDVSNPAIYLSSGTNSPDPEHGPLYTGLFHDSLDSDGVPICDGMTLNTYSGTSLDVMAGAYPLIRLDTGNPDSADADEAAEIFAELGAKELGFPDSTNNVETPIDGSYHGIENGGAFMCTRLYVSTLFYYGREPNSMELASWYYVVPNGSSSPYGPTFKIYSCDNNVSDAIDYHFGA